MLSGRCAAGWHNWLLPATATPQEGSVPSAGHDRGRSSQVGPIVLEQLAGIAPSATPDRASQNTPQFRRRAPKQVSSLPAAKAVTGEKRSTLEGATASNQIDTQHFGPASMPFLCDRPPAAGPCPADLARRLPRRGRSSPHWATRTGATPERVGGRDSGCCDDRSTAGRRASSSWRTAPVGFTRSWRLIDPRRRGETQPSPAQLHLLGRLSPSTYSNRARTAPSTLGRSAAAGGPCDARVATHPGTRNPGTRPHRQQPDRARRAAGTLQAGPLADGSESAGIGGACHGLSPRLSPRGRRPLSPAAAIGGRRPPARISVFQPPPQPGTAA